MSRLMRDLNVDREKDPSRFAADRWDPSQADDDDDDEEADDENYVDMNDKDIIDRRKSLFLPPFRPILECLIVNMAYDIDIPQVINRGMRGITLM